MQRKIYAPDCAYVGVRGE